MLVLAIKGMGCTLLYFKAQLPDQIRFTWIGESPMLDPQLSPKAYSQMSWDTTLKVQSLFHYHIKQQGGNTMNTERFTAIVRLLNHYAV